MVRSYMKMPYINPNGTKPYIIRTTKKQDGVIHYNPNDKLVNFLREQLDRRKRIEAGIESLEGDIGKRNPNLDRMKVHYLDKIFKAMADLAFFFEAIAKHPELDDLYGDDVRDLLGVRHKKRSNKSKRKPLCGFMFYNFLHSILKAGELSLKKEDHMQANFRLILNNLALEIVTKKVSYCFPTGYKSAEEGKKIWLADPIANRIYETMQGDFNRALVWTGILKPSESDDEEEPNRTFDFDTDNLLGEKKQENGESS